MRAAVIHGPRDLRVERVPDPEPGEGELLVRTLAASICNATDVHIFEGDAGDGVCPPYPHILGHERAAEVVAVGPGVSEFEVGDRVACWAKMDGAFGELDVLRPREFPTVRLRDGLSDEAAALLEPVAATLRCLHSARLGPGERVLVVGQGVQGLLLMQEARELGAGRVIAVDLLPSRLERSRALGADAAYGLGNKHAAEALSDLRDLAGGEVDLVVDATGHGRWEGGNSVNLGLELLAWGGRYVMYGLPTRHLEIDARLVALKGVSFEGIRTPPAQVRRLLELGARWAAEGRLRLGELVTHRVPLARVEEGLALCRDRPAEVLKVMVEV